MKTRWALGGWTFVVAAAAVTLVGCGGTQNTSNQPDPEVRFVNGVPDTANLDFVLNDEVKSQNLAYQSASADFESIEFLTEEEGGYDVSIRRTGTTNDLDIESRNFQRDTDTLVVAIGLQNPGGEPVKRARLVFVPVSRLAPTGNRARLVFLNGFLRSAGFDTPNVTFQSIIPGDPASIDNPQDSIRDVPYGDNRLITVDTGNRTFIVRRADTDALVQYAEQTVNLLPGRIYLALVTGQEANPTLSLQPSLRFIEISTQN